MLTELSLKNFKSWKSIDRMRMAPITGLFGANSSGKTSIIQLLLMLKQTVQSPDRAQPLIFGDEKVPPNLGSLRDVLFGHDTSSHLGWEIKWNLPRRLIIKDPERAAQTLFEDDKVAFRSQVKEESGHPLVDLMSYEFAGHTFSVQRAGTSIGKYRLAATGDSFSFKRIPGRAWPLPPPVKCYGFPDQVRAYFQNAGFLFDLQLAFEELFGRLYYLGPLREYPRRQYTWSGAGPVDVGQRGEQVVDALLTAQDRHMQVSRGKGRGKGPQPLEQYVAEWLKKLGLIYDFSVGPVAKDSNLYRVQVQRTPSSAKVLITDVGFGLSQVLPAIVLCYYVPRGSVILMEQPEIHLHPSVQAGLADVFIDAVKRRKVQIVIESHSEHLLRRLQRRMAEEDINPDDISMYFCQMRESESELTKLDLDLFGNIRNWPKDFFGDEFGELAAMTRATVERQKRAEP
jgi:predicted ATPase